MIKDYTKEEKSKRRSNAKKTALTLAAGALIALGGKALYDKNKSENIDNDKKDDKKEVVAEAKTNSINIDTTYVADTNEFINDKNNKDVVISNSVLNTGTINTNSGEDNYFKDNDKEVETIMNSDGMTTIYSDGTKVIMDDNGITTIKKNGDKQNINDGKITKTINGKTTVVQSGAGNNQNITIGKGIKIKNSEVNGVSVSSSNGETTVTKNGKTTTVKGNGNVSIINGQIYIDGKLVDTGKDR